MSDDKDLKAWCHWKRKEKDLSEDDALFVKAVEGAISQAGMVLSLRTQLAESKRAHDTLRFDYDNVVDDFKDRTKDYDAVKAKLDRARAWIEKHHEIPGYSELLADLATSVSASPDTSVLAKYRDALRTIAIGGCKFGWAEIGQCDPQFANAGDIKKNYSVHIYGTCIDESEDNWALARRLRTYAKRLMKIADFLDGMKQAGTDSSNG